MLEVGTAWHLKRLKSYSCPKYSTILFLTHLTVTSLKLVLFSAITNVVSGHARKKNFCFFTSSFPILFGYMIANVLCIFMYGMGEVGLSIVKLQDPVRLYVYIYIMVIIKVLCIYVCISSPHKNFICIYKKQFCTI